MKLSSASGQIQFGKEDISIRELYRDRELYENYPKFQRGFIWPMNFKQELIDSILRGCPIHPLLAKKDMSGEGKYWIIDGQQRMRTVRAFLDNEFKTMGSARETHGYTDRIEPNKYFQDLSPHSKGLILSYRLTLNLIEHDVTDEYIELLFRRIQHQKPLVAAEKLAAYTGNITDMASRIEQHKLWSSFYLGNMKRKELFQASLYLIAIEHAEGYTYLKTNHLHEFVAGKKDLRENLERDIISRLDTVICVFSGIKFRIRIASVIMYQAVLLLEKLGYRFQTSYEGLLTDWLIEIIQMSGASSSLANPLRQLAYMGNQQKFWEEHLPEVIDICEKAQVPKLYRRPQVTSNK